MTDPQYAEPSGMSVIKLRKWESNQVWILKSTGENYFK